MTKLMSNPLTYSLERDQLIATLESGFVSSIGDKLQRLLSKSKTILTFNKPTHQQNFVAPVLKKVAEDEMSYLVYAERTLVVPENFTGNLYKYAVALHEASETVFRCTPLVVTELSVYLTQIVSNPSILEKEFDLSEINKKDFKIIDARKEFFKDKGTNPTPKLNEVINTKYELKLFSEEVNKLCTVVNGFKLGVLERDVIQLTAMIDTVITSINDDPAWESVGASKSKIKRLVELIDKVAELTSLSSILYYESKVLIELQNKLIDKANESF